MSPGSTGLFGVGFTPPTGQTEVVFRSRHHPVLGTVVDVQIATNDEAGPLPDHVCQRIDAAAISEMDRLEAIFSVFDPDSELERWKRGEAQPGPELRTVLALALTWQERSGGSFNLGVRSLHELWRRAEARDELPTPEVLRAAVTAIAEPPYRIDGGSIVRTGEVDGIDLNALAKGWIVDRAVESAREAAVQAALDPAALDLVISAGGDLRHRGSGSVRVGIEHPLRPYDNEPPLARVRVADAALATSGGARRGFRVRGLRYSHLIDPRSGEPADEVASISVLGPDAATADVVATIAAIEPASSALTVAERFARSALMVTPGGHIESSAGWPANEPG